MIFVTVGHQMPFDRLIKGVDAWAGAWGRDDVFAQIGDTSYAPAHIKWVHTLRASDFREKAAQADAIVAHAGTGTILTAAELHKPLLVMPRKASLRETRNEHQSATAQRFGAMGYVHVAADENELPGMLDRLSQLELQIASAPQASPVLIQAIRSFIHGSAPPGDGEAGDESSQGSGSRTPAR